MSSQAQVPSHIINKNYNLIKNFALQTPFNSPESSDDEFEARSKINLSHYYKNNPIYSLISTIFDKLKNEDYNTIIDDWDLFEKRFGKKKESDINHLIIGILIEIEIFINKVETKDEFLKNFEEKFNKFLKIYDIF